MMVAQTTPSTIETRHGSRTVIASNANAAGTWESRLYCNRGEVATLVIAKHKTRAGAIRWAKKTLTEMEP